MVFSCFSHIRHTLTYETLVDDIFFCSIGNCIFQLSFLGFMLNLGRVTWNTAISIFKLKLICLVCWFSVGLPKCWMEHYIDHHWPCSTMPNGVTSSWRRMKQCKQVSFLVLLQAFLHTFTIFTITRPPSWGLCQTLWKTVLVNPLKWPWPFLIWMLHKIYRLLGFLGYIQLLGELFKIRSPSRQPWRQHRSLRLRQAHGGWWRMILFVFFQLCDFLGKPAGSWFSGAYVSFYCK